MTLEITIGGRVVTPISARVVKTIDTVEDGFSAKIPFTIGEDLVLEELTRPRRYVEANVVLEGNLLVTGLLYDLNTEVDADIGRLKRLFCFSYTADAADSTMPPPYERKDISLIDYASEIASWLGVEAIANDDGESAELFKRVTCQQGQIISEHLKTLVIQRGLLLSNTIDGDLLIHKAKINSKPVGTIDENAINSSVRFQGNFSGRKCFNSYTAIGDTPGRSKKKVKGVAVDPRVPRYRFRTFSTPDITSGNAEKAAKYARNQAVAESLSIFLEVPGWLAPNGLLWRENTIVTAVSPTVFIEKGYNFLIRRVEYILESTGKKTILSLVPPSVYTDGEVEEPWFQKKR